MYARINPAKLGLAGGILWGLFIFFATFASIYTGWGMFWLSHWMDFYPGFSLSAGGAIVGMIYGFIHGFISWFLIAFVYNLFKP